MKLRIVIAVLMLVLLVGCSSKYNYHVEPTPLKEGITKYSIDRVTVNLSFGHGNLNDGRFENQEQLTESFRKAILKNLKEKNLLAETKEKADALIQVNVDYKRVFNWGGKALSKPKVSYDVNVYNKESVNLADFGLEPFTTSYGTFGDMAVGIQIAAFKWGKQGELKDVNTVSKIITTDLAGLGD